MPAADPDLLFRTGLQQMKDGAPTAAVESFEAALAIEPDHVGALVSLGSACLRLGRTAEAEARYRAALTVHPGQPVALRNLAVLLDGTERYAELLTLAETALAEEPAHPEALLARGNALVGLGRAQEAAESYAAAAKDTALQAEALTKLGMVRAAAGDAQGGLEALDEAVALRPAEPIAHLRRALIRLQQRDFAGGWDDYDARWRVEGWMSETGGVVPPALVPRLALDLSREDVAGQRVLLLGEQGIGDQVMFASMIPDLIETAASVTCVCDPRLVSLFADAFPGASFAGPAEARISPSAVDRIVAMGSLGRIYRRRVEDFPGDAYLSPKPDVVGRWSERLGPRPSGLRIGLSWRGGTPTTRRNTRSVTLEQLAPVLALPGCEFVSLQYGDVAAELAASPTPIRSFDPAEISDYGALAGLVGALDVVVSVQTALVHLCGAVGANGLILVPHFPEWRYGAGGVAMPWYRSVRLFRQPEPGAWSPVIQDVADTLKRRLADPGGGSIG